MGSFLFSFPLLPFLFLLSLHVPHLLGHFFPRTDFINHNFYFSDLFKSCLQGKITISSLGRVQTLRSIFPAVPFAIICSLQLLIRIENDQCIGWCHRLGTSRELNVTVVYPRVQRQQALLWACIPKAF